MNKYIIKDWADNILFDGKEFECFESAWEFLFEMFPDEDCFDDYVVRELQGEFK